MHLLLTIFASIFILSTPFSAKASSCAYQDLSLHQLLKTHFSKVGDTLITTPHHLTSAFEHSQDLNRCPSVRFIQLRDNQHNKPYSLLISHDSDCDGGNTFGLFLKGHQLRSDQVIGLVADSYVDCL